jgi:hypothetical protein
MATKRKRASSWEFVVRRKGLLPKPLYLTFATEAEGDHRVRLSGAGSLQCSYARPSRRPHHEAAGESVRQSRHQCEDRLG